MHEFELESGGLFIHLLRMSNAVDRTLVYELGRRYVDPSRQLRDKPASHLWGWEALDRFLLLAVTQSAVCEQCLQLKRLAARDFADLL